MEVEGADEDEDVDEDDDAVAPAAAHRCTNSALFPPSASPLLLRKSFNSGSFIFSKEEAAAADEDEETEDGREEDDTEDKEDGKEGEEAAPKDSMSTATAARHMIVFPNPMSSARMQPLTFAGLFGVVLFVTELKYTRRLPDSVLGDQKGGRVVSEGREEWTKNETPTTW